ncbi:phosphonate metabolism protein PhnM [Alkalicoccobacillus murimartini]|uniref:Alpha-D-ribose 1-methylphosphonate 5-triphosphate diphosphatase n=1 Tax=Alkalicoccobacillus murimartini TaxID=171685 RepID=A0ABT9YH84_9BACI|nr:phosphonate metabolism protein PhnM [Alkalicoccobacillus murimartini]MDQ0206968.1 alpha-D-ribose 1-methylphosphonate 5-triphosphate diphosphatase [Alkalicoccobacillus murimartini]
MIIIHNGQFVLEEGIVEGLAILIEGEQIKAIIPEAEVRNVPHAQKIDANGGYVSPGFIDIHSDYIESLVSPRPTSMMDVHMSLREAEKTLIGNGITTMFHSLSFYREDVFTHKPMRYPENVQRLVDAISQTHEKAHLIRHRLHARFEIDNLDEVNRLMENIKAGKVDLLSFMDHTPGQGQYRNLEIYRDTLKGYRDISDEELTSLIEERVHTPVLSIEQMKEVAELAQSYGIALASHDDDDVKKIELVQEIGTTISEFPITLDVAKKANECGLDIVVGAPNIMLGGSHSGNLSAVVAIQEGCADILCSDYYPSAILHSIFALHEQHGLDLHQMFQLATRNPAKAVKLDHQIGSITPGLKADLLIIEKLSDGFPTVTSAIINGEVATTTNYRNQSTMSEVR